MSSPLSSMDAAGPAQTAYSFMVDPHVQTAIWAIVLAVACALVLIIAEMVKQRDTNPAPRKHNDPEKPR